MKREGGQEAGYCKNMISDRGDRCLFNFYCGRHLLFNVFPFPVCKTQLKVVGNENGGGSISRLLLE
jgi:hypothetical protein